MISSCDSYQHKFPFKIFKSHSPIISTSHLLSKSRPGSMTLQAFIE